MAVVFPLKLPGLVTKRRVKVAAAGVWCFVLVLSLIPYCMNVSYHYNKPLSICIWTIEDAASEANQVLQ